MHITCIAPILHNPDPMCSVTEVLAEKGPVAIFLTGMPGAGKTHVVRQAIDSPGFRWKTHKAGRGGLSYQQSARVAALGPVRTLVDFDNFLSSAAAAALQAWPTQSNCVWVQLLARGFNIVIVESIAHRILCDDVMFAAAAAGFKVHMFNLQAPTAEVWMGRSASFREFAGYTDLLHDWGQRLETFKLAAVKKLTGWECPVTELTQAGATALLAALLAKDADPTRPGSDTSRSDRSWDSEADAPCDSEADVVVETADESDPEPPEQPQPEPEPEPEPDGERPCKARKLPRRSPRFMPRPMPRRSPRFL